MALLSGTSARQATMAIEVNDAPIATGLAAVRLRADGRVQAVAGSHVAELDGSERLVFVSPRAQWPEIDSQLGVAILDKGALGAAYDVAHAWALRRASVVTS